MEFPLDVGRRGVNIRVWGGTVLFRPAFFPRLAAHPSPIRTMMVAHDSSSQPPSRLSDESVRALRDALRQYLSNGLTAAPLQAALLELAREAREKDIMPEHLLIVLKDVWADLVEVRAMTDHAEQARLLQRVVTMCIKEYYSF